MNDNSAISSPQQRDLHLFNHLIERCKDLAALRTAVCYPGTAIALAGAIDAAKAGLIEPILVGPSAAIREAADALQADISAFPILDAASESAAAEAAVALCRSGKANALMKGSLHTDVLMREVLRRDCGLRRGRRISHVFVLDTPEYARSLLITDAAVNIKPQLQDKADIIRNAVDLAIALGVHTPKVAILSAVETVSPGIASTIDAAALCKMAERGQIAGAILDGPLAFDTAISAQAAASKGLASPVAGEADILLAPDLESANMLAKQLEYLGGAKLAGIVLGATVPIILTSRSDSAAARLASCAVAVLYRKHSAGSAIKGQSEINAH